jgi:hypothetical protein
MDKECQVPSPQMSDEARSENSKPVEGTPSFKEKEAMGKSSSPPKCSNVFSKQFEELHSH